MRCPRPSIERHEKGPRFRGPSPRGTSALSARTMVRDNKPSQLKFLGANERPVHGGQQALFRGLVMRRLLNLGKRRYCRPIKRGAIRCELRSVTRAIPALLQRVPVDDAAEMSAAGGMQMQLSFPVPACGDLLQSATHQTTLTGPQPLDG